MTDAALILADGAEHRLEGDTLVGRDPESALVLDDETVSRRHAVLALRKNRWYVADTGSFNGTLLNGEKIPAGVALQLRHADRLQLGAQVVVFSSPDEERDRDRTQPLETQEEHAALSPFQLQVVECLCADWLGGASLDRLPSNRDIAALLGTPDAVEAVKAALRRVYAKAGLTSGTAHEKRRDLCRVARQRGWI